MARFLGTISVSPYPDGVTWYLDRPLTYVTQLLSGPSSYLRIPRGFETDFASVPKLFTNIFPRWDVYGEPSVVHDWLYWTQPVSRETADNVFREAMHAVNVPRWKAFCLYRAVRMFGQWAWDDNARIGRLGFSRIRTRSSPKSPMWSRHGRSSYPISG